jgi:uncharacterized protein (TIGR00252 family)
MARPTRSDVSQGTTGDSRKRLGNAGERLAAEHLRQAGYVVRTLNYRCRAGEIDVVAEAAGDIVFVEVKTRRGEAYGLPEEAVTLAKQRKLIAAGQAYLEANGCAEACLSCGCSCRGADSGRALARSAYLPPCH